MKTIKIRDDTKARLDAFPYSKSITKTMKMIVDNAEEYDQYESKNKSRTNININMNDDVFDKFLKCKKYPNESHSDTIERLLDEFELSDD